MWSWTAQLTSRKANIVLTFCEIKEDMDAFYSTGNRIVASFLERAKPLIEQMPQRSDYVAAEMIL